MGASWTPCPECPSDPTIRGCVWGAWDRLIEAGALPPSRRALHDRDPARYHAIKRELEAAWSRLADKSDGDGLPERVAAEFTTPSVPTQGVLL